MKKHLSSVGAFSYGNDIKFFIRYNMILRAKYQNQIDISLEFLYNLSKIRNAIFKGEIYEV